MPEYRLIQLLDITDTDFDEVHQGELNLLHQLSQLNEGFIDR